MNEFQKSIHVLHLALAGLRMLTSRNLIAIILNDIMNEIASTNKRIITNDNIGWLGTKRLLTDRFPITHHRLDGIITDIDSLLCLENTAVIESMTVEGPTNIKAIMTATVRTRDLTTYDIGSCRPFNESSGQKGQAL